LCVFCCRCTACFHSESHLDTGSDSGAGGPSPKDAAALPGAAQSDLAYNSNIISQEAMHFSFNSESHLNAGPASGAGGPSLKDAAALPRTVHSYLACNSNIIP